MKPMLAKRYAEHIHKLSLPLFVQPKLNGIRAIHWNSFFQSRDENIWQPSIVDHLVSQLTDIPSDLILDGELYVHGWPLQKINGAISINRKSPNASTPHVQYHVFDCIFAQEQDLKFSERHARLREVFAKSISGPHISLVDTHSVHSISEAEYHYGHYRSLLYEGMMYRADVPYGFEHTCTNKENRWDILLKRKEWLDEDCLIVDVELGTGKYHDCVGKLVLVFPNGQTFRAGSGLSDLDRKIFMDQPPIGRTAKIKYEMLSEDNIPLKPTIELIYD